MSTHKDNEIVGVKAEPKFLREQTRFEQITSFASHVGTTLTNSLPKRRSTPNATSVSPTSGYNTITSSLPTQLGQSHATPEKERVTFASFDHTEVTGPRGEPVRLHTLNLGYPTGVQLWDITSPDNVHELCSIKDEKNLSNVRKVILLPRTEPATSEAKNYVGPLVAILAEISSSSSSGEPTTDNENELQLSDLGVTATHKKYVVQIYSLRDHAIVEKIQMEGEAEIVDVRANGRVIVVATKNPPALHLYSPITFKPTQSPITDISTLTPIYSLGSRLLAYASTSVPQVVPEKDNNHTGAGTLASLIPGYNSADPGEGIKVAKEVLGGVASGVRSLGEIGYVGITTLTGYLSSYTTPAPSSSPVGNHLGMGNQVTSISPSDSLSSTHRKQGHNAPSTDLSTNPTSSSQHDGVVAIRDFQTGALMTCFRSYNAPIRGILFNPTGAHILTTFSGGQTFHIHAIQPPSYLPLRRSPNGALSPPIQAMPQHLIYRLSRGITSAEIESFDFSQDGLWCSVSTARGTTHIFPVHPIGPTDSKHGGLTEIPDHVSGRVKNVLPTAGGPSNISAIVRIKQRNGMIDIAALANGKGENGTLAPGTNGHYHGTSPSPPHVSAFDSLPSPLRAHLISSFLPRTRNPYLLTSNTPPAGIFSVSAGQGLAVAKGTLKGVAGKIWASTSHPGTHVNGTRHSHASVTETPDHEGVFNFENDEEEFYDSLQSTSPTVSNNIPQTNYNNYDIYTFNPIGILTLHRLWILRKDEHVAGREGPDTVAGCEDIAEWKVSRAPKWAEIKTSLKFHKSKPTTDISAKHAWLAQAEIQTYDDDGTFSFWNSMQVTFNHFQGFKKEQLERILDEGGVPTVRKIYDTKDVKEANRSKASKGSEIEGKDPIIMQEDISTAMNGEMFHHPILVPKPAQVLQPSPAHSVHSIAEKQSTQVQSSQPSPAQSVFSLVDSDDVSSSQTQQETNAAVSVHFCKPSLNNKKKSKKGGKRSKLSTPEPKEIWDDATYEIDLDQEKPETGTDIKIDTFIDLDENHW